MTGFQPGIPQPCEYNPFYESYIGKCRAFADPIQKLNDQQNEVSSLLHPLNAQKQSIRYAPGKWSVKEVLGHLIDAERVMTYRAMRVARGDQTPLPGFDENSFVAEAQTEHCDWNELLSEFSHVRHASILLFHHFPEESWLRTGTANGAPISVRALLYIVVGHTAHHLTILRERYLT